jgi:O-antigen/teichoic acid export membrane protein
VSAFGEGEGALQRAARRPIELVLVLSAPMAAGTAMVAGIVVPVLYGPAYTKAVPVLILLGLCLPPMYLSIMLSNVLLAAKRQKIWTWIMVVATIVNPVFNLIAIPLTERLYGNGAIGAAVSLLATELGLVTIGLVIVGRSVLDRAAVRRCVLATAASAAMWGAGLVSRPLGDVPSVVIGVATFVVLALVLRVVTQDELQFVRARVRRAVAGRRRV